MSYRIALLQFLFMLMIASPARAAEPLEVVPSVDLDRYKGLWHEVARLPNRFQKACVSDISANYTLRPDGKIEVLNTCRQADGKMKSAKGTAKLASKTGPNSKLRVTFFWPFYGNYWIIDLDADYQWAVVGEPGRGYLWVLSRTPVMEEALLRQILERARQKGFDTSKMIFAKATQ